MQAERGGWSVSGCLDVSASVPAPLDLALGSWWPCGRARRVLFRSLQLLTGTPQTWSSPTWAVEQLL